MIERRLFTSNSVLKGHPDKLCDRISDAIVDAHLNVDTHARIRAEAAAAGQVIFVTTDARLHGEVDVTGVVRRTLVETGYDHRDLDPQRCTILSQTSTMTPPWAQGRRESDEELENLPAGEQTTVFGYACTETPERMPLAIRVAHLLAGRLDELAGSRELPKLGPDGSVQVTIEYVDDKPARIDAVVVQAVYGGPSGELHDAVRLILDGPLLERYEVRPDKRTRLMVNAEGPLTVAGPARNAGHTGRKQVADTYGGAARHGDGALSGKDPSRIDRCAAYAARHAATNVVAAGLATECELMLSYAIGEAEPTTVYARTFGRGQIANERLSALIREVFDFRPGAIGRRFGLWTLPKRHGGRFYRRLATGGQLGRTDVELPWEQPDAVEALQRAAG